MRNVNCWKCGLNKIPVSGGETGRNGRHPCNTSPFRRDVVNLLLLSYLNEDLIMFSKTVSALPLLALMHEGWVKFCGVFMQKVR